jgi:hypothetical protein
MLGFGPGKDLEIAGNWVVLTVGSVAGAEDLGRPG